MSLSRTISFVTLAVFAAILLVAMFLIQRTVQVVHFDDVHRVVTNPPNWMPTSPVTKAELETPKRLLAKALVNQQIIIADGFEIQNTSAVTLIHVAYSCHVDGQEQVFDWPTMTADPDDVILPGTSYYPEAIVWRMETVEAFTENKTSDLAILHPVEINWLLAHKKVTACKVFEASSK